MNTMKREHESRRVRLATLAGVLLLPVLAGAIEVDGLKDFAALHGRYAPWGDCAKSPRIVVDTTGFTFEVNGAKEQATRVEYAASYGGNAYEGITKWFMPFHNANGWPLIMAFNAGEKPGLLTIDPHDEGWQGGPALSARNQALVKGSPYARCK
jgi:hypothetical protein